MRQIRQHLTYANVMATIAVFLVLTGGTAVALSGSNTVFSDDIVNGEVLSADVKNNALTANDVAQDTLGFRETATSASDEISVGSIDEWDVADNSLGFRETPTSASDEIKFGSIDHFDVADGSLAREDFQNGVLPEARFNQNFAGTLATSFEQITSRYVPAGSWVAFANLRTNTNGSGNWMPAIHCELRDPGGVIGWGIDGIPDRHEDDGPGGDFDISGLGSATFTIQAGSQAPSGGHIISVWCKKDGASGAVELDAQLMLIKVDHFG
jgi:hypothetical protein